MSNQDEIVFEGILGEVVHTAQSDGRVFERYRRAPGVRLIVVNPDGKLIMTRERRQETGNVDLRLPGGKVCDSMAEYHELLTSSADLTDAASRAAIKEGREELGLELRNLQLVTKAAAGSTVEWDLYYFMTHDYVLAEKGQQLEAGEEIETVELTPDEVRQAIADGQMQEWRSVGILLGLVLPQLDVLSSQLPSLL